MAVAFAGVGTAAIALRGYLVPGTPALSERFSAFVRTRFGQTNRRAESSVTALLVENDVLDDDLTLTTEASSRILDEARDLHEDRPRLETQAVEAFPAVAEISVNRALGGGETWFAHDADENTVRQWSARPVAALDVAAADVLSERLADWESRTPRERDQMLALVRYGTSTCPACDEQFDSSDGPRVACCGGRSLAGDRRCSACSYSLVDRNDLPADEGGDGGEAESNRRPTVTPDETTSTPGHAGGTS